MAKRLVIKTSLYSLHPDLPSKSLFIFDLKVKDRLSDVANGTKITLAVKGSGRNRKLFKGVYRRVQTCFCECCGPSYEHGFTPGNPERFEAFRVRSDALKEQRKVLPPWRR